jgi:nitroreductase
MRRWLLTDAKARSSTDAVPMAVCSMTTFAEAVAEETLAELIRYAALAPSWRNKQPWLIRGSHDTVSLYADRTRALPVYLGERELTISCGAALFKLRLAVRHLGVAADVQTFPDDDQPDLLAGVRLCEGLGTTPYEEALFDAIGRRRGGVVRDGVPRALLVRLADSAAAEEARLHVVYDGGERRALAQLVAEGDWLQSELPVMAVLGTTSDRPADWLAAGQALQHVLLRAAAFGVEAFHLN